VRDLNLDKTAVEFSSNNENILSEIQSVVNEILEKFEVVREVTQGLEDIAKIDAVWFTMDMLNAGHKVILYKGKFGYRGPAVYTDREQDISLQDIIRDTEITVLWDRRESRNFVVYPDI
jgi:hypothetical protein